MRSPAAAIALVALLACESKQAARSTPEPRPSLAPVDARPPDALIVNAASCEQACRTFATLKFWERAETEIAQAPADQREAIRTAKRDGLVTKIEAGIGACVRQCESANNPAQTRCMIEAKTAAAVQICADS